MLTCEHVLVTIYAHNRYDTCRASHAQSFALPQILSAVQAHENFRQVAMLSCTEAGRCPAVPLRSGR